jgi:hypothetical protein
MLLARGHAAEESFALSGKGEASRKRDTQASRRWRYRGRLRVAGGKRLDGKRPYRRQLDRRQLDGVRPYPKRFYWAVICHQLTFHPPTRE